MLKIIFFILIFIQNLYAVEFPSWASDIKYEQIGSCETNNLSFNAARFSKINLNRTRDGLDLYLQLIFFFKEDGLVNVRTQEMGLAGCNTTSQGEVCSYRPYSDTKKLLHYTWTISADEIIIENLGSIKKIRDDFPWLGFELSFLNFFPKTIGGKVQINVNDQDQNTARLCPQ